RRSGWGRSRRRPRGCRRGPASRRRTGTGTPAPRRAPERGRPVWSAWRRASGRAASFGGWEETEHRRFLPLSITPEAARGHAPIRGRDRIVGRVSNPSAGEGRVGNPSYSRPATPAVTYFLSARGVTERRAGPM